MKKIVVNPEYSFLSEFINSLPEDFSKGGITIYKGRNEVKVFDVDGLELVVKSFKVPHLINQGVYAWFRSSKAERSYMNGLKLLENSIGTPEPIAYIEIKTGGLFKQSFYISKKSPFHREFREVSDFPRTSETDFILSDFALFTATLHNRNIYHKDYTPGNILFEKMGDHYSFELVDINRMKFLPVSMDMGCRNLDKLCIDDNMYRSLAREYAKHRNFDPDVCERLVIKYRDPDA